jgi:Lrp/AsnC family transcriptional regulator for asnA, asnC and gidA
MDELDTRIIEILQNDGRASNAGIARTVGVSEGTVRRRLKRLIQGEYIRVVAVTDPAKMGYVSEGLIGLQADLDKIDSVADELAKLEEVSLVTITTGAYDIFAWATLESAEALGIFLRARVATIPGVRRTETFVNLAVKKRGYGVVG